MAPNPALDGHFGLVFKDLRLWGTGDIGTHIFAWAPKIRNRRMPPGFEGFGIEKRVFGPPLVRFA